ncbi:hypothetical protein AVEN_220031-1 [Araneus ventricosus]|uniref:Uncharacterized protein n=1 Tax=Araneus ventricosus TaxID=182803 RepID=A0A4Y2CQ99_ARAVE|nr:hypothetical protein AVEN_220031-1 [Araneus ventricosus]
MGIVTKRIPPSLNMSERLPRMASRWPSDYFLFSEIEGILIWNKVIFRLPNGQGKLIWNWINGQGRDSYQAGLNKLVLRSDKCLNRFGDYVER